MTKVKYAAPIANIEGAWAPGCVCRQKKFRVGKKVILGPQEIFHRQKRDDKRKPLTEAELLHITCFKQASDQTKLELSNPERAIYWKTRFLAQLKKPEPGNTKIYHRLDNFIRAMLMKELKTQS